MHIFSQSLAEKAASLTDAQASELLKLGRLFRAQQDAINSDEFQKALHTNPLVVRTSNTKKVFARLVAELQETAALNQALDTADQQVVKLFKQAVEAAYFQLPRNAPPAQRAR